MCSCTSCKYTDAYTGFTWEKDGDGFKRVPKYDCKGGFENWPRGEPAGALSSARAYNAHVAHSRFGAKAKVDFGPTGSGFYGTPAGMTKRQVEQVLSASFASVQEEEEERMAA